MLVSATMLTTAAMGVLNRPIGRANNPISVTERTMLVFEPTRSVIDEAENAAITATAMAVALIILMVGVDRASWLSRYALPNICTDACDITPRNPSKPTKMNGFRVVRGSVFC